MLAAVVVSLASLHLRTLPPFLQNYRLPPASTFFYSYTLVALGKGSSWLALSLARVNLDLTHFSGIDAPEKLKRASHLKDECVKELPLIYSDFSATDTARRSLSLRLPLCRSKSSAGIMGSLPPFSADFINPHSPPNTKTTTTTQFSSSAASPSCMDETTLLNLFKSQQSHLNFFFQHLDLPRTLAFTQTLLLQSSVGATIFFSGVGKSGFVAHKISQTLVSLGIRSGFLCPLDALHGDIGALSKTDVLVLFSKSGTTEELLRLVPCAKAKGAFLISVTSVDGNALASVCDMNVHLPLQRELCPFDLAPVTSTAIQMVFGDTVAIALMGAKNLTKEQYAANHPAGRIGKSLIFKVKDVMKKEDELPVCKEGDLIMEQLVELTSKGCGCLLVIDAEHRLIGTFTDGDLRRTLKASGEAIFKLTVGEMCNRRPRTIGPDAMAVEAMQKMEAPPSPVQFLPVINDQNQVIGIVTLHGLVSAGL